MAELCKTELYGIAVLCGTAIGAASGLPSGRFAAVSPDGIVNAAVLCSVLQVFTVSGLCVALCCIANPLSRRMPLGSWREHMPIAVILVTTMVGSAFCAVSGSLSGLTTVSWTERIAASGPVLRCRTILCESIDALDFNDIENNALVKALITGDRSGLSRELVESFRKGGASHILALSGLHFGVIYMAVNYLLRILGNSVAAERIRAAIAVPAAAFYTALTGAGASVCRAFLFILIRESAYLSGRRSSLRTVMWASFICQSIIDASAISSVSFQLSYAAIAGIVYINPHLSRLYDSFTALFDRNSDISDRNRHSLMRKIWQSAALSLSCQLTTAPLAWHHFHSFPPYFLISNLLALPAVGIIIPLSVAAVCVSALGIPATLLLRTDEMLLGYMRWVLRTVASI